MNGSLPLPANPGILRDKELELLLDRFETHPIHRVPTYQFQMIHSETRQKFGNLRLSVGSTPHLEFYAGHIGYGVLPEHRGHHYAGRSVQLIVPFAHRLEIDPLWITCDPENTASRRTLELIGAELIEIVDVPENCIIHRNGHPRKCRYRL